ncbi:CLUMA_CG007339, isoform A [Clunio marinus]|uniref:Ubiquitin carboxyl-terminal hydrolase 47 n=1 Tax=Clunio marinus TaxID=568069 RepID=A0A1J1I2J5_9DIPT|nr:CLUMA_CG007339, isoform A [Clunio marinus]
MVYLQEGKATCRIIDQHPNTTQKRFSFVINPTSTTVKQFLDQIVTQFTYEKFDLIFETKNTNLNDHLNAKLSEIGIEVKQHYNFLLKPLNNNTNDKKAVPKVKNIAPKMLKNETNEMSAKQQQQQQSIAVETEISSDDDLALGASASPTEDTSNSPPALPALFDTPITSSYGAIEDQTTVFRRCNDFQVKATFVGLVNQAMTCYLNSLLQALYMTPEFRNALYNWEFDGSGESKSIPFQLQKLFVNLQTSNKLAVETTDLTKSFGWDSTEAWQQHDIQELCRVMFDALEQKFKNTKQADLINCLYEGKMIDYVKCLECETEKSREDTFLDIPLPVRPFGSSVAYESVEEALKAFVQPETLDGNNQYFCEKCNKKCDAHKGLKFKKFPYILTLHLKRFDFDYQTLHRIKLNDKVTFPQQLNLNSFTTNINNMEQNSTSTAASATTKPNDIASIGSVESAVKCDDCSTTDSVLDEEGSQYNQNSNQYPSEGQEDDEGIDMSVNGDCKSLMSNSTSIDSTNNSGPFNYDLFAIMIHSGSASGGHYYAYIKDFETGCWYSFNDQTVSPITQDDISKSFGGSGAFKSYYSGFSSSTNAYMLMYRQQDPARNKLAIKQDNFPPHITKLVERIKNHEEDDRMKKERESEMLKLKIYFKNPLTKQKSDAKVFAISESTLKEVLEDAYSRLKIKSIAPIERCRLVAYDSPSDGIERSFEGMEKEQIGDIMYKLINRMELLLEVRDEGKEFEEYLQGGVTVKLYQIFLSTSKSDIDGPFEVRAYEHKTIEHFKTSIRKNLGLDDTSPMTLAVKHYGSNAKILQDDVTVKSEDIIGGSKVFMTVDKDLERFKSAVEDMNNVLTLYFTLPNNKKETLEKLSIPTYEEPEVEPISETVREKEDEDVVDSVAFNIINNNNSTSGECNSEDSSLSDSDRTLIDDSNFTATTNVVIPKPPRGGILRNSTFDKNGNDDESTEHFFKAILPNHFDRATSGSVDSGNENDEDTTDSSESQKILKVFADRRMNVNTLKMKLQRYIKIPMEYFKIFHVLTAQSESECTQLTSSLNSTFKDEECLAIELGRALRTGEFKVKLYYLNVAELTDIEKLPFVCDYILRESSEVGQTKREIIAHLRGLDEKYANLTYERANLRKKSWKSPGQIYLDDQKFGDDYIIKSTANPDIIIQELQPDQVNHLDFDGEPINEDSKSLFVRQFYPSKLELGKWVEIMIGKNSELKGIISKISGIEEDKIMYTKLSRSFVNTSIMHIDGLPWFDTSATMDDNHTLSATPDGSVYLYKDNTEPVKQLTTEERLEISKKENAVSSTTSTYSSPRRERGLKIYLDSPKKRDDS